MKNLKKKIKDFVLYAERTKAVYNEKQKHLQEYQQKHLTLTNEIAEIKAVNLLLEKCNITARKIIKVEVESLVTSALQSVFEDPSMAFKIEFLSRRNQVEAEFSLSMDVIKESSMESKTILGDIFYTYGGGVIDVIAMSLRLVLMELLHVSGPIFLDEPGKMIAEQHIDNFGRFLKSICAKFERQMILITHNSTLAQYADNQIRIKMDNKISKVIQEI